MRRRLDVVHHLWINLYFHVMIQRKKPDVDVLKEVLEAAKKAYPKSEFVHSLAFQYEERGGLSKKQLEGLLGKMKKLDNFPPNWIATMEALILKKPQKYRSALPENKPLYQKQERETGMIDEILSSFPLHKRVLFFKSRLDNNNLLTASEILELERFYKLLKKQTDS
jgi:hypothetical protein